MSPITNQFYNIGGGYSYGSTSNHKIPGNPFAHIIATITQGVLCERRNTYSNSIENGLDITTTSNYLYIIFRRIPMHEKGLHVE